MNDYIDEKRKYLDFQKIKYDRELRRSFSHAIIKIVINFVVYLILFNKSVTLAGSLLAIGISGVDLLGELINKIIFNKDEKALINGNKIKGVAYKIAYFIVVIIIVLLTLTVDSVQDQLFNANYGLVLLTGKYIGDIFCYKILVPTTQDKIKEIKQEVEFDYNFWHSK